jgi:serine/threonine protein kinase
MKMLGNEGGQHRCVVRMLGCMSRAEGTLGLVLEYCPGGNLLEHVKQMGATKANEEVNESPDSLAKTSRQFARFGWQICDGMLFLGTKNLVHRDLAARNVLLDGEQCAKVEIILFPR